ncbi:MAG TPA: pantoate--beta-alanine ligase, partial [Solirubrobacterales bacterium]|nr:pantoate--beta-alanine ligase [Solirubrobacterales bacterium]
LAAGEAELAAAGIEPEYLEARDPETLAAVAELGERPVLVAVAAPVGGARLIDNVLIDPVTDGGDAAVSPPGND